VHVLHEQRLVAECRPAAPAHVGGQHHRPAEQGEGSEVGSYV
jgi:hypothetical protein